MNVKMPKSETIMPKMPLNKLNFQLKPCGQARNLQIQDVEKFGQEAYDNVAYYKKMMNKVHDQFIQVKLFSMSKWCSILEEN